MADGRLRTFTDEQWNTLVSLLDKVKHDSVNTVQRQTEHSYMSPEVYIARIPIGGIPALDDAGTGTSSNDAAGKASCDIFKIDSNDGIVDAGFNKEIYNIQLDEARTANPYSNFIPVLRTKFGKWIAAAFFGIYIGKLDGELAYQSYAVMSIYKGSGSQGGNESDTGDNLVVYDWLLGEDQTIAAGKKVVVIRIFGVPYVISAEC